MFRMKRYFFPILTLTLLVTGTLAFAQALPNPDESLEQTRSFVNKIAAWGVGITAALAVFATVVPLDALEGIKRKCWGALAFTILLFFFFKMFPSVGQSIEEMMKCPLSTFGLKCS